MRVAVVQCESALLPMREGHVTMTIPNGTRTLIESPRLAGCSRQLVRTRPNTIDARTVTAQQSGDRLDLDYATNVIATNIQLARTLSS